MASIVSREDDFVARYGGEEFLIVLPNTDEQGARGLAEKILETIRRLSIPLPGSDIETKVTISIGVASGSAKAQYIATDYINMADELLYESKQNGRNRYTFKEF
jgi:diguanylate cyclase (GGDEF)-like protein